MAASGKAFLSFFFFFYILDFFTTDNFTSVSNLFNLTTWLFYVANRKRKKFPSFCSPAYKRTIWKIDPEQKKREGLEASLSIDKHTTA